MNTERRKIKRNQTNDRPNFATFNPAANTSNTTTTTGKTSLSLSLFSSSASTTFSDDNKEKQEEEEVESLGFSHALDNTNTNTRTFNNNNNNTNNNTNETQQQQQQQQQQVGDEDNDYDPKRNTQQQQQQQHKQHKQQRQQEGVSIPLLPLDTFSYLAFSKYKSEAMITSIIVMLVQSTTIGFLLFDTFSSGDESNFIGVPAGVSPAVSFIQAMTLFIGVFSQTDFQDSLNTLLIGYHSEELRTNLGIPVSFRRWLFALVMRILISLLGLLATFFLIVTGNNASDLLLDFTAVEFITNLDNIFFWLTAYGYLGYSAQRDASKLVRSKTLDLVTIEDHHDDDYYDDAHHNDNDNQQRHRHRHHTTNDETTTTTRTTTTTTTTSKPQHQESKYRSKKQRRLLARRSTGFGKSLAASLSASTYAAAAAAEAAATADSIRRHKSYEEMEMKMMGETIIPEEGGGGRGDDEEEEDDEKEYDIYDEEIVIQKPKSSTSNSSGGSGTAFRKLEDIFSANVFIPKSRVEIINEEEEMTLMSLSDHQDEQQRQQYSRYNNNNNNNNEGKIEVGVQWQCPRFLFLCLIYLFFLCGWLIILIRQKTGHYLCKRIFVQFDDSLNPDLATFTGKYNYQCRNGAPFCSRGEYVEEGHGKYQQTAVFGFCHDSKVWTFAYTTTTDDEENFLPPDSCKDWQVKSDEVSLLSEASFDMLTLAQERWYTRNTIGTKVPLPDFHLRCYDCDNDPLFCGGDERGSCVNNHCVCKDGWHGARCEFKDPCDKIEIDPLHPPFQGTRTWAEKYKMLVYNSTQVEAYNRPVYVSDTLAPYPDVIFFNGLRWAITSASTFVTSTNTSTAAGLSKFFIEEFHSLRSKYAVNFLSAPVVSDSPFDSNSPINPIVWFQAFPPKDGGISTQKVDLSRPLDARFLCSTCSDDNPCNFEGVCTDAGVCDCITGSSGQLCQIPPVRNGRCDTFFNTPEFSFDGGDCCEETCISTEKYACGKGIVGNSFGVDAVGFVGFTECSDPQVLSLSAGSKTLFNIRQRGYVKCGLFDETIITIEFEEGLCAAIAAAVVGDPEAYEVIWTAEDDIFTSLRDDAYDILMGAEYSAGNDVYEESSGSSFDAPAQPYLFHGLALGGLAQFVTCGDQRDFESEGCIDTRVCFNDDGRQFRTMSREIPEANWVLVGDFNEAVRDFQNGICNVIVGDVLDLSFESVQELGYTGNRYRVGDTLFSNEYITFMTRSDDRVWSKFTNWVLQALIQAEESGVTKDTADEMGTTNVFGNAFENMFKNAVAANGNFGELWNNTLASPRVGFNLINDGTTGLLLPGRFRGLNDIGLPPVPGGDLETIIQRGSLKCGVGEQLGFATIDEATLTWSGMDVDICRAIAASLGVTYEILPLSLLDRFSALVAGAVDISMGISHTLEREVKHPGTSGEAFDFSPTYFYDGLTFAGQLPHGACAANLDFERDCSTTKICVSQGSTWLDAMRATLNIPERNIVVTESHTDSIFKLSRKDCNAIAGESVVISEASLRKTGLPLNFTEYMVGSKHYTKEPLAIMSRSRDPQFSDYLRWLVYALFKAEEDQNDELRSTEVDTTILFGSDLLRCWQNAIAAVGHFGSIWDRNWNGILERKGRNILNRIETASPQQFAHPGTI